MVVIYDRPRDLPGGFAVRDWNVGPGIVSPGRLIAADVESLSKARTFIPDGMVNNGRQPEDESVIVEVWV